MAVITLKEVTKQFGTQKVLNGVNLEFHPGERAGLIGVNGSGKTTLLRLLTGELTPDTGDLTMASGSKIAVLQQEPILDLSRTLHDEVLSVFDDLLSIERDMHAVSDKMATEKDGPALQVLMDRYERFNARFIAAGGHKYETRLNEILGGLGFAPSDYTKPVGIMSGGQKTRTALAKLLLADSQFLLLDEPTNHLDIDAVRWLEKFLASYQGGALIVSHDRYLLDNVCNRIVELEWGRTGSFPGNYSNYHQTKETRLLTQGRELVKDKAFIDKERAFITKHISGQRTKEAQGRRKRLDRMLADGEFTTDAHQNQSKAKIEFSQSTSTGTGVVVRVDDLAMSYGELKLFHDLTFKIQAGQRFGITGPNGTGKTTLLKILMDIEQCTAGEFEIDAKIRVGYYSQEYRFDDDTKSPLDLLRETKPEFAEQEARNYLARFLFKGDGVFKPLRALSGGEQSRIRLACLILESPDMLVLDEPTNHLDIASREVLEEALSQFPGTIVSVSHDRYFLDRLVDRLMVMRPNNCTMYEGNYSFYLQETERVEASKGKKSAAKKNVKKKPAKIKASPYDNMSVSQLEALVIEKESELAVQQERFGDTTIYSDPEALAALNEEVECLERELKEVDAAWQHRVENQ